MAITTLHKPRRLGDRRRLVTLFRLGIVFILCTLAAILGYSIHNIVGDIRDGIFSSATVERMGGTLAAVGAMIASLITKRHVQQIRVEVDGHFTEMLRMQAEKSKAEGVVQGQASGVVQGLAAAGVVPPEAVPVVSPVPGAPAVLKVEVHPPQATNGEER
jgi:hypothetical protein